MPTNCGICAEIIAGDDGSGDPAHRIPCPKCGSTSRRYSLIADPGAFLLVGADVSMTVVRYPTILLRLAQRFADGGDYGVAIIVVHMACEVATERSLGDAFAARGIPDLEQPVESFMSGYNLANPRNRDLYNALARAALQDQPFWSPFCASATRRNKIIHQGWNGATKAHAEESIKACTELVAYLKQE